MKRHDVICYHSLNKALTNLISFRLFPAIIATAESICYSSYFQLTLSSSFFFHIIFPFIEIVDPREIWRFLNWQALRNHFRAERWWNCRALGKVLFAARGLTLRPVSTPYSTTWNWSNFLSFSFDFSLRRLCHLFANNTAELIYSAINSLDSQSAMVPSLLHQAYRCLRDSRVPEDFDPPHEKHYVVAFASKERKIVKCWSRS